MDIPRIFVDFIINLATKNTYLHRTPTDASMRIALTRLTDEASALRSASHKLEEENLSLKAQVRGLSVANDMAATRAQMETTQSMRQAHSEASITHMFRATLSFFLSFFIFFIFFFLKKLMFQFSFLFSLPIHASQRPAKGDGPGRRHLEAPFRPCAVRLAAGGRSLEGGVRGVEARRCRGADRKGQAQGRGGQRACC